MKVTAALPLIFAALSAPTVPPASAAGPQNLLGDWITPNQSVVQIYNCSSALCARITHVNPAVGHTVDGQNPDQTQRSRPLCGLVIGKGFKEKDASHAEGGTLYDPESGRTYSGTLTLASDTTLKLRGYVGISLFGRTEQWTRASQAPAACTAAKS